MRVLKWIAVFIVFGAAALQVATWNFYRGYLPADLSIWLRVSAINKSWGWGPGGSETGFNEFVLPTKSARQVSDGGQDFLAKLSPIRTERGWTSQWYETPPDAESSFVYRGGDIFPQPELGTISAQIHLERFGFGIHIPQGRLDRIDRALNRPGSFYTIGRGGRVIVLSPEERRIWLLYAG